MGSTLCTTQLSPLVGVGPRFLLSSQPPPPQGGKPGPQGGPSERPSPRTPGSQAAWAMQGLSFPCRGEGSEAPAWSPGPRAGLPPSSYVLRCLPYLSGNAAPTTGLHPLGASQQAPHRDSAYSTSLNLQKTKPPLPCPTAHPTHPCSCTLDSHCTADPRFQNNPSERARTPLLAAWLNLRGLACPSRELPAAKARSLV